MLPKDPESHHQMQLSLMLYQSMLHVNAYSYVIWIMYMSLILWLVNSHLLTSLQFVLHFTLFLLWSVILCCHLCSYLLMKNDNMTTTLCAHFTFSLLMIFHYYFLSLSGEFDKSRDEVFWLLILSISPLLTYSNSGTILVIWLQPSNESYSLRLTSNSTVFHQTGWTYCIFPFVQWLRTQFECYTICQK